MSELLIVGSEQDNTRLDRFLADQYEEYTRSFLQKLIDQGNVSINGISVKKSGIKLKENDEIAVTLPEPQPLEVVAEDIPLDILYEDDDVILINKPKGMVVHPAAGHTSGTIVNALLYHCKDSLSGINGVIRPGIVHRIDMDTTGVIIACKNDASHNCIAAQLKEHSITRRYYAIVHGNLKEDEGVIDAPIGRDPNNRKRMAINHKNGKNDGNGEAGPSGDTEETQDEIDGKGTHIRRETGYKVLERFGRFTWIECRLETGRTHQIRVHMASIGHSLLGDALYGPTKCPYQLQGQTLHAYVLGFIHPSTGEYMEFQAPLPDYFEDLLKKLRQSSAG